MLCRKIPNWIYTKKYRFKPSVTHEIVLAGLSCHTIFMATPDRKWTLRTCCSVHALHDGMVDMLYALLPLLREALGLSYTETALIRSVHQFADAAFQIPIAIAAEKAGERNLLILGTLIVGGAFLALGFADGYSAILAFVFVAGFGAAFCHPLSSSIVSQAFSGAPLRTALGIYNAAGDVGKFIFLGSTILATASLGYSWQVPVLGFGVAAIIIAMAALILLNYANAGGPPGASDKSEQAENAGDWGIKHRKGFYALSVIAVLDNATRVGFLIFVSFLMIEKGVATEWAASAVVVTVFGGMCGKYAVGLIAARIGVARSILLTEIATAVLIVIVVAVPSLFAFLLLPFVGVFLNGTSSAIYGTVPELIEGKKHSRAYGLIYTTVSGAGLVAPLIYGQLADFSGVVTTMIVMAAGVLLTIPLCGILARSLRDATGPAIRTN
ncbi:MAG: MFS transporter [Alphaproteobacteria bacterium]|nr:MFS transporter [Alphaproteobacteria bacterium]